MKKHSMTPEFLAALTGGAVSGEDAAQLTQGADAIVAGAQAEDDKGAADAPVAAGDAPAANAEAAPAAVVEAGKPVAKTEDALVSHLRNETREIRAELATANAEIVKMKAELESAKAVIAGNTAYAGQLETIVRTACSGMAVALSNTTVGLETMTGDALVKFHTDLSSAMKAKYRVGPAASASGAAPVRESASVVQHPARSFAVQAAKIG